MVVSGGLMAPGLLGPAPSAIVQDNADHQADDLWLQAHCVGF